MEELVKLIEDDKLEQFKQSISTSKHIDILGNVAIHCINHQKNNFLLSLLDFGIPIDYSDEENQTLLCHSIMAKNYGACKILILRGANVNHHAKV